MAEHDSLETKYQNIDSLKEHYRIELGLAIRNYPIHFTKENDVYYGVDVVKDNPHVIKVANDVVKGKANVTKEFAKTQRQIYKLISQMPQISAAQMSENMGISLRQVQRYLKQLSDQNLIVREEERKNGVWRILDDEYEGFFKRI
nr:winged helix-turn-helix domain-containing protein [uncultured Prevotella sp.]